MKTRRFISSYPVVLLSIFFLALLINQCSVKAPEVNITGEKTALENQVIGTYEQIEEDVWTLASVRSTNTNQQTTMSDEKKRVLEAVRGRKFNKDDIVEFLEKGYVGENNQGLLELIDAEKLENDSELKNRVVQIIKSENDYRKTIMDRIILLNEYAAEAGEKNVAGVFANINQDNAPSGSWIQNDNGEWIQK